MVNPGTCGTGEEPGTLTQGARGSLVWESNPKLQGGWFKTQPPGRRIGDLIPTIGGSGAHPPGLPKTFWFYLN